MKVTLVPRESRFFALFEREAGLVRDTLAELSASLQEGGSRHERLRELEHACDRVTHEIYTLTNHTFTTPIERGDILSLAHSLDGIVDLAEEASDKIDLYNATPIPEPARRLGECLRNAGVEVEKAVRNLERPADLAPVLLEIHRVENEGDRITREALQLLLGGRDHSAVDVIKWKDLYDLLETTMDECESVAEIIETIAIKNG